MSVGGVLQIAPYSNKKHYPAAVAQAHRTGWGGLGLGLGLTGCCRGVGRSFPRPAAAPRWLRPWAVGPQPTMITRIKFVKLITNPTN